MLADQKNLRIAVVGSGAAGMTAAYLLNTKHHVTIFEKNSYLGGHTNTITLDQGPDIGTCIDTGFIVFNDRNYPTLLSLFKRLQIEGQPSDMSFSYSRKSDRYEYSSYFPRGLLARKRSLLRPGFYRMIFDILRFNKLAIQDLENENLEDVTLGAYLEKFKFSESFMNHYLIPMGAAIWSTPMNRMLEFPARSFIRFFFNHGLLALKGRPHWMTVPGGSQEYIKVMLNSFSGNPRCDSDIQTITRDTDKAEIRFASGQSESFDYVVLAAHADESLRLLDNPSKEEKDLLGCWTYNKNTAVLHTDESAMPDSRRAWASWNYLVESDPKQHESICLTYHMNRLQDLSCRQEYFVTLNRQRPYAEDSAIKKIDYTHPRFDFEAVRSQDQLPSLNGKQRTFFCGSYFGYGFHEDAVKSAVQVTQQFGINL